MLDMYEYSEEITVHGIAVPFVPEIITEKIERPMRRGRYERGEVELMRNILRPGDRLLELGAGVGVVSSAAATVDGVEAVLSIEADPTLVPMIEETWRLNGVTNATLRNGIATAQSGEPINFYVRSDFWASSMEPDSRPYERVESVPAMGVGDIIKEFSPTVLSCDIEGAELGLLDQADLSGIRHIVMELHPKVYGPEGLREIIDTLGAKGFLPSENSDISGSVKRFDRVQIEGQMLPAFSMPRRSYKKWPVENPRILVATCMKNEGPFILEWIAWHRAIGVTDFVVYTNDCTDGTDKLLDRLDDMGIVKHLPNPALAAGDTNFQPRALRYTHYTRDMREADFVISMDVDEFINVHVGDGTLLDLFEAAGEFDVLSMSELNHGSNGKLHFARDWVTKLYPSHESATPGKRKAHRGLKSITRLSPRVQSIRNHRPDLSQNFGTVKWLDGSGRRREELLTSPEDNGWDARGSYELVTLEHFPLRSLECFLVKMHRGDVVVANKRVSNRYWRTRNRNEHNSTDLTRFRPKAQKEFDKLIQDTDLAACHEASCEAHEARIASLAGNPEFEDRKVWIFDEAWGGEIPEEYRERVEAHRKKREENA
ncbi:FkbM family methyltransferase [Celeribacter litoreus]|uniref:FkbM family methyltransferase n=1 Tax=Celeribacter litoreus TaxID=2876714 RepID=UPI001CCB5214|nr:FkbM family methyltransferase [Celeribacter litoreus]MCA0044011.1 FkbM family methyltransferase [Celeribacter litoreus]